MADTGATLVLDQPASKSGLAGQVHTCMARGEDVVVVIPTLNEGRHIEACVRSLMTGDKRLKQIEMIVADGGSRDWTRAVVEMLQEEFPNLRLLHNPKRLQSAAVNAAARGAGIGRRILVRCDAHAIYPPNYVMQAAGSLARRGVASVVVPMDADGITCFQKPMPGSSIRPSAPADRRIGAGGRLDSSTMAITRLSTSRPLSTWAAMTRRSRTMRMQSSTRGCGRRAAASSWTPTSG